MTLKKNGGGLSLAYLYSHRAKALKGVSARSPRPVCAGPRLVARLPFGPEARLRLPVYFLGHVRFLQWMIKKTCHVHVHFL